MGRYSGPIGMRSQCEANGTGSNSATITFLGELRDITAPEAAVARARVDDERRNRSVRQQWVDNSVRSPRVTP